MEDLFGDSLRSVNSFVSFPSADETTSSPVSSLPPPAILVATTKKSPAQAVRTPVKVTIFAPDLRISGKVASPKSPPKSKEEAELIAAGMF